MQRVYVEKVVAETRFGMLVADETEESVRDAVERIMRRAEVELTPPVRLMSASLTIGLDGVGVVVAVVAYLT